MQDTNILTQMQEDDKKYAAIIFEKMSPYTCH